MLITLGIVLGILIAAFLRPTARNTFAIDCLTSASTVLVVAMLPVQGLIVSLIGALGLRLAWAQLINGMTERGRS
ncbi:hypothetical protein [Burkholderia pseudomallei]|uniref:hypothetical protein n=1 Tax=Burkholderia pseudomallei TaxID=28450 RepID=UPI000F05608B|nr:hypothetical protein [Burkholderia pseudomallei]VBG63402.1 Uncharacterised protein [Burkholderia pseudomallei]